MLLLSCLATLDVGSVKLESGHVLVSQLDVMGVFHVPTDGLARLHAPRAISTMPSIPTSLLCLQIAEKDMSLCWSM